MNASVLEVPRSVAEPSSWWPAAGPGPARCRTTRWSLVLLARDEGESGRAAVGSLYRLYLRPVLWFIARRRGAQAAEELAQEFFGDLVERQDFKRVEWHPEQRFRSWLFKSLQNFLNAKWKYDHRQCRDVSKTHSLSAAETDGDAPGGIALPASGQDPERMLERARALALLSDVLARLRCEYCNGTGRAADRDARFEALKVFLPGPSTESASYALHAQALGLSTDAVKHIVLRLRRRFVELLNEALREPGGSEADVAAARRALCQALELPAAPEEGK